MSHRRHGDPVQAINEHADDLVMVARAFSGHSDVTAARAERVDRDGIHLLVDTRNGPVEARVAFSERIAGSDYPDGLRVAFVRLTRRARDVLAADRGQSSAS